MADPKKPEGKKDKKDAKPAPSSIWTEYEGFWWLIGGIIFLSAFFTNWNGVFFNVDNNRENINVGFPAGKINPGSLIVNKETALVRIEPAGGILGKQKRFIKGQVKEGPVMAYNEKFYRIDYEHAPDGWVAERSLTSYGTLYIALHIIPISWGYIKVLLWIISAILISMILYAKIKYEGAIEEAEKKLVGENAKQVPHIVVENEKEVTPSEEKKSNERWMHVLQLLESYNQSDWRAAIIEADIILEEMLEKMAYEGASIGDKLKNVETSDFLTLNQAWEAHKVRNKIAHGGSDFAISQHEARKVIGLYQEVFEEFYYI